MSTAYPPGGSGTVPNNSVGDAELDNSDAFDFNGTVDLQDALVQFGGRDITGSGGTTTLNDSDHYVKVDASSNGETVELPGSPSTDQVHVVKQNGSNNITVDGNGNNIRTDGSTNASTFGYGSDGQVEAFEYDGTQWEVVT